MISFERSEVTLLPGKYFCLSMRPRDYQWPHCRICTLQQEEEDQYKHPGIPHQCLSTCRHGLFFPSRFVIAMMTLFSDNGINSSKHVLMSLTLVTAKLVNPGVI